MWFRLIIILSIIALNCDAYNTRRSHGKVVRSLPEPSSRNGVRRFPDNFRFGTATAAYQIEGAWNADGKGENIWDHMVHENPSIILDRSNADTTTDSYHNYKRDVEMLRELGVDTYRFSLSWSRILPEGFSHKINQEGVQFYNNYINEMLKYNITPMVTLYHWDLPQKLQEYGGFLNPMISDWYEEYVRLAFELFGDRVKHWITFNEPCITCNDGYGGRYKAPNVNTSGIGEYLCIKNVVLSHAKAYHAYQKDFKSSQHGQIGITMIINWQEPLTDSEDDALAAELKRQAEWGVYVEPIFSKHGGFPREIVDRVAEKSAEQGYAWSRMPEFTDEEREFVRGSADFLGVNHYTAFYIAALEKNPEYPVPSLLDDIGIDDYIPHRWPKAASPWLTKAPRSLYKTLMNLKSRYNPTIIITENGWSARNAGLIDDDRVDYYRDALEDVLDALNEGVKLKGYIAWSLMDNFEWNQGFTERFGLYQVDYSDAKRTRTPRKSAFVYKQVIKSRVVDHHYEPDMSVMTIDRTY
uniref:Cytosolic beta-glucosidase n=1 Tax=Zygaena filipendulae TaxID=287375 RepID=A0A1W1EGN8_9NEOP|nr:beta-glucosidase [Zygaena filipendulae]